MNPDSRDAFELLNRLLSDREIDVNLFPKHEGVGKGMSVFYLCLSAVLRDPENTEKWSLIDKIIDNQSLDLNFVPKEHDCKGEAVRLCQSSLRAIPLNLS